MHILTMHVSPSLPSHKWVVLHLYHTHTHTHTHTHAHLFHHMIMQPRTLAMVKEVAGVEESEQKVFPQVFFKSERSQWEVPSVIV